MAATIQEAHKRLSRRVMGHTGVVGTAIGLASGKPCLKVYVARETDGAKPRVPSRWEGYPVVVENTGSLHGLSS